MNVWSHCFTIVTTNYVLWSLALIKF